MEKRDVFAFVSVVFFVLFFSLDVSAKPIKLNMAFQDSVKSHGYTQALAPWVKQVEEATKSDLEKDQEVPLSPARSGPDHRNRSGCRYLPSRAFMEHDQGE